MSTNWLQSPPITRSRPGAPKNDVCSAQNVVLALLEKSHGSGHSVAPLPLSESQPLARDVVSFAPVAEPLL